MSTGNLPGGEARPARKSDFLTAICELTGKCGSLDVSQLYECVRPVTRIPLLFLYHGRKRVVFGEKYNWLIVLNHVIKVITGLFRCSFDGHNTVDVICNRMQNMKLD
jgi:hypothetical protein